MKRWAACLVAVFVLLVAGSMGSWRGTGTGAQVQVPMFYDEHYLFPRAWTQFQAAPGVPDATQLRVQSGGRVSQSFVAEFDQLQGVAVGIGGNPDTAVTVRLTADNTQYETIYMIEPGQQAIRWVYVRLPSSAAQAWTITLFSADQTPFSTWTVGGDRLGSAYQLNEYGRPGNIALRTYGAGIIGTWWLDAIGEQLLPDLFQTRIQQYKPGYLKGSAFAWLAGATVLITLGILLLGTKRPTRFIQVGVPVCVVAFLGWQIACGGWVLPGAAAWLSLQKTSIPLPPLVSGERQVYDFTSSLWTAERLPDERFVITSEGVTGAKIDVPAESALRFPMLIPYQATLRLRGQSGSEMRVRVGNRVFIVDGIAQIDLSQFGGQAHTITFESDEAAEWLDVQLWSDHSWLLTDTERIMQHRFADTVDLIDVQVTGDAVTLLWERVRPTRNRATVFIHVVDTAGNIVAQADAPPLQDTYPIPVWQPGAIIQDVHTVPGIGTLSAGAYDVAIGLYDPASGVRWSAGTADDRVLIQNAIIIP